jgi:hypothetical protein
VFKPTCFAVITLFLLLTGSLQSSAQNKKFTIIGSVVDAVTLEPLPNVNISIVGTSGGGTTNAAGEFSLTLTRIPAAVYFSYLGYGIGSWQVEKSNEKNIMILLKPETREIEEVTIRAERISKVIRGDTLNIVDYAIDEHEDLDNKNFTQQVFFDSKTGKAYAFFRLKSTNMQSLREIDLETGKIERIIEIPDYLNISKIQVYDNTVYFLYDSKVYPFYRLLYRMVI